MRNKYKLENFQRTVIKNKFVLSTGLNSSANFLSNDFQFPEEISRDFYRKPEKGELKNTMKGTITEPQRQPFLLGLLLTYVLGPWFTGLYLGSQKYWALSNPPSHLPRWWLVKWWRARDGERRRRGLSAEHPAGGRSCNGQSGLRSLTLRSLVEPASMCVRSFVVRATEFVAHCAGAARRVTGFSVAD